MSDRASLQEALESVYGAIVRWMEAAKNMGRPVPGQKRATV